MLLKVSCLIILTSLFLACSKSPQFSNSPDSQSFSQHVTYNNKVDILWVMDNSTSMKKHQENISKQIDSFVDTLVASQFDFHLGVITTDIGSTGQDGNLQGDVKVMTSLTTDLKTKLRATMVVGDTGWNLEQGLGALKLALSTDKLNSENAGFLRSDATLAVIVVSDEDDHSVGTTADYISFLDELKPAYEDGTRGWLLNFIGVTELTGTCRTYNNYADPGLRYMALADVTNGLNETICTTDFAVTLSNIRVRIVSILTEFVLDRKPIVSSITVAVDGKTIAQDATNGWTYDSTRNSVRFHGTSIPGDTSTVTIDFLPAEVAQ